MTAADPDAEPEMVRIEAEMLSAHAAEDHEALVSLYRQAADIREREGDVEAACFYLTHAYVFALETGHPDVSALRARLAGHGREPDEM